MSVPHFDGFWHSENNTIENDHSAGGETNHVGADDDMTGELAETSMGQGTEFLFERRLETLNEHLETPVPPHKMQIQIPL